MDLREGVPNSSCCADDSTLWRPKEWHHNLFEIIVLDSGVESIDISFFRKLKQVMQKMACHIHGFKLDFRGGAGQPYIISSLPIGPCAWAAGEAGTQASDRFPPYFCRYFYCERPQPGIGKGQHHQPTSRRTGPTTSAGIHPNFKESPGPGFKQQKWAGRWFGSLQEDRQMRLSGGWGAAPAPEDGTHPQPADLLTWHIWWRGNKTSAPSAGASNQRPPGSPSSRPSLLHRSVS